MELTELAGHQPVLRELVRGAFEERLGPVELDSAFHRGWNGGWRCRATVAGKRPLEFALLVGDHVTLLAWPVPMPMGWRLRGVAASNGTRWTADVDGLPVPVSTKY